MSSRRRSCNRLLYLLGITGAFAFAAVPLAGAAPKADRTPLGDSVVGAGTAGGFDFSLSVQSGPEGQNPVGTFEIPALFTGQGSPTCLSVQGRSAVIGVSYPQPFSSTGLSGFLAALTDNGSANGGAPVDTVDFFSFNDPSGVSLTTGGPTTCPAPGGPPPPFSFFPTPFVLDRGDVTITDAPSPPTSKEQCKNGGWREFGDAFKNQGQCVAFVERGPKP
jgi:hypothetical protein